MVITTEDDNALTTEANATLVTEDHTAAEGGDGPGMYTGIIGSGVF